MPGSMVSDANEPVLFNTAIVSKTTTTGAAVEVNRPTECRIVLELGTLTGSAGTCDVEIQSSDDSSFATGVVSHGRFAQFDETATGSRFLPALARHRYMRAKIITAGTTVTTYTLKIAVREEFWHTVKSDSA